MKLNNADSNELFGKTDNLNAEDIAVISELEGSLYPIGAFNLKLSEIFEKNAAQYSYDLKYAITCKYGWFPITANWGLARFGGDDLFILMGLFELSESNVVFLARNENLTIEIVKTILTNSRSFTSRATKIKLMSILPERFFDYEFVSFLLSTNRLYAVDREPILERVRVLYNFDSSIPDSWIEHSFTGGNK